MSIWEYDEYGLLKNLLDQNRITPNDNSIRTGQPLLFLAISRNRTNAVKLLVDYGADLEYKNLQEDYLFWALRQNCDIPIISNLLESGKFQFTAKKYLVSVGKSEELHVNNLLSFLPKSEYDQLVDEGDEDCSMITSILEALIKDNFYSAANLLLEEPLPNTMKRLREINYIDNLNRMIDSEPIRFDLFSKSKRKLPDYSKDELKSIKTKLETNLS